MKSELEEARALVAKAGMETFLTRGTAYCATSDALFPIVKVAINRIEPIVRGPGIHTFVEKRALSILDAIKSGKLLPPVMVYGWSIKGYEYTLYDGFHRYYLSRALGFSEIFVSVNPYEQDAIE